MKTMLRGLPASRPLRARRGKEILGFSVVHPPRGVPMGAAAFIIKNSRLPIPLVKYEMTGMSGSGSLFRILKSGQRVLF